VEIDGQVEAPPPQIERQHEVVAKPPRRIRRRRHNHIVEVRIALEDGRRERFDQIAEPSVWVGLAKRADGGRRQHDVADEAQSHQQNA
jgi:hypothetical protein